MKKYLQIAVDGRVDNKKRDNFVKKLVDECNVQNVTPIISHYIREGSLTIDEIKTTEATVYTKPNGFPFIYDSMNVDVSTKAKVIFDIIDKEENPKVVLVVGRKGLVGLPLVNMLINSRHQVIVADRFTDQQVLDNMVLVCDIVVSCEDEDREVFISDEEKRILIDATGSLNSVHQREYSMEDIEALAVQRIVSDAKNHYANSFREESCDF